MFTSVDPSTGATIAEHPRHDRGDVDMRMERAFAAYQGGLGQAPLTERCDLLRSLAAVVRDRRDHFAALASQEMGKPITDARAEIDKCIAALDHYATAAPDALEPTDRPNAVVQYQALGPILAIMPWNFPFWQVFRVLAPAIALGNPLLLKHAENVLGCATAIEEAVRAAGSPTGSMQTLAVGVDQVPDIIADDRVRAVTFTGSVRAGRAVAELAGRSGKKSVLELGGSDPFLVLADADLAAAAAAGARSRLFNSGQACIAAKRFIVDRTVHDEFVERLIEHFQAAVMGPPMDETTTLGPMARVDLRDNLDRQVQETVAQGANLRLGGQPIEGGGFYYPATLLTDVDPAHTSATEETFGPVGSIISVGSADEAAQLANDTPYGLGACVFTTDMQRARAVATQLEVGVVAINDIVASRPDLPFGGVKASGYGRELGTEGLREFANIKTVMLTP